jgi:hypothetical protein
MVHTMKDQVRGSTRSRRQHEREFKDDLIAQSLVAGASVSAIAMKGGINANLLFKWRREHVRAMIEPVPAAGALLPVCVIPDVDSMPISQPSMSNKSASPGRWRIRAWCGSASCSGRRRKLTVDRRCDEGECARRGRCRY